LKLCEEVNYERSQVPKFNAAIRSNPVWWGVFVTNLLRSIDVAGGIAEILSVCKGEGILMNLLLHFPATFAFFREQRLFFSFQCGKIMRPGTPIPWLIILLKNRAYLTDRMVIEKR
jgi:hypothetical protein